MEHAQSYAAYLKSPYRSLKHSTYFQAYDELFSQYRGKPITFVEIGILGGGSLFMWREFFGPEARIIGVDLDPNAAKWNEHGFEIFIGSQSDPAFWQSVVDKVGPMDIVLDDGGHTYQQQIVTTECLIDNVKDGGMLVVEDTHTSYMPGFGPKRHSFIKYVNLLCDRINHRFSQIEGRSEHRIWSIQVFESIVAFRVNRSASNLKSFPTDNGGAPDEARDFRYDQFNRLNFLRRVYRRFAFVRNIPGVERAATFILQFTDPSARKGVSKYFD